VATLSKVILSGSTNGTGISVSATAGTTTIHQASSATNTLDELHIFATTQYSQAVTLTIEWTSSAVNDRIKQEVLVHNGLDPVITGLVIRGAAVPLTVKAFVSATNSVTLHGYVNRIVE
jgi:hypothetical protein